MTPSGIEPATFRFVAQYLNYCATAVPHFPALAYAKRKQDGEIHEYSLIKGSVYVLNV
jgi:hypothetical protein